MATLRFKSGLRLAMVALACALLSTSCVSFKHKTFPELARYNDKEVEVVRVKRAMMSMCRLGLGSEIGKVMKGMKGVEVIECKSRASVADCRKLLAEKQIGDMLIETIDRSDTLRIYGYPLPDGRVDRMMIVAQEAPDDMQLIVISGKVDIAGNLSELTGSI